MDRHRAVRPRFSLAQCGRAIQVPASTASVVAMLSEAEVRSATGTTTALGICAESRQPVSPPIVTMPVPGGRAAASRIARISVARSAPGGRARRSPRTRCTRPHPRAAAARQCASRSPRTVQHRQPAFSQHRFSSSFSTSRWSRTDLAELVHQHRGAGERGLAQQMVQQLVLPAPRKPVRTVTGMVSHASGRHTRFPVKPMARRFPPVHVARGAEEAVAPAGVAVAIHPAVPSGAAPGLKSRPCATARCGCG